MLLLVSGSELNISSLDGNKLERKSCELDPSLSRVFYSINLTNHSCIFELRSSNCSSEIIILFITVKYVNSTLIS